MLSSEKKLPRVVGERVRELRKERQLTMAQLAEAAGMSQPALSKFERGLHDPQISTVAKIARALEVDLGVLLREA